MAAQDAQRQGNTDGISSEAIFKAAKEVVVKFIEVGKLSPSGFEETFTRVYHSMEKTVRPK